MRQIQNLIESPVFVRLFPTLQKALLVLSHYEEAYENHTKSYFSTKGKATDIKAALLVMSDHSFSGILHTKQQQSLYDIFKNMSEALVQEGRSTSVEAIAEILFSPFHTGNTYNLFMRIVFKKIVTQIETDESNMVFTPYAVKTA